MKANGFTNNEAANKNQITDKLISTISALDRGEMTEKEDLVRLLENFSIPEVFEFARELGRKRALENYSNQVFIRGLIEVSSFCSKNCFYCGIRCGNKEAQRYRLSFEDIMSCCESGYSAGFRTFVMQGGEDPVFDDGFVCRTVAAIKQKYPDCAVTLSLGERSYSSYKLLKEAGADRYLLRHETASKEHYEKLHPKSSSFESRMECLYYLKELGYQTGAGFMVGSPWQTMENIADDLIFLKGFNPQMVGIGPFLPHSQTPFKDFPKGSAELTLFLLSLVRIMLPKVLLPATTALGTREEGGRERGILHGANVIMPNLSPLEVRKKYMLYDNKLSSGAEASEGLAILRASLEKIGYRIPVARGDSLVN